MTPAGEPAPADGGAATWKPSGVVTLLTDFGVEDVYAGVMKGVLLSRGPELTVVDLSHGVPPQEIAVGAWFLACSRDHFPAGTVHVAVVDPGVGSERRILAALDRGQAFLAPDNGLLGPVLSAAASVVALDVERFALAGRSRTFHGRDVFAPAAAALATGLDPRRAGTPHPGWQRMDLPGPREGPGGALEVPVLLVDRFGNLVTRFDPADLPGGPAAWTIEAGGRALPLAGTYAEVAPGQALALVGSSGTLEVSVRGGNAARELALGAGSIIRLARRTAP